LAGTCRVERAWRIASLMLSTTAGLSGACVGLTKRMLRGRHCVSDERCERDGFT